MGSNDTTAESHHAATIGSSYQEEVPAISSLRWIIRGTLVVPTGNPFDAAVQTEFHHDAEQQRDGNETSSSWLWLGPGLKLLLDHVLAVNHQGIIVWLANTKASCELLEQLGRSNSTSCTYIHLSQPTEFLCPGLIDLHLHAPQFAYTGTATDLPLMGPDGWLETYTFPAEARLQDDLEMSRRVYQGVVSTTLSYGTTTVVYFATLHLAPCQTLVDTCLELGQRALVGKVCMDRHSPDYYCQSLEQNLHETEALIDYIRDRQSLQSTYLILSESDSHIAVEALPLVMPVVTPRFIPTCTPALLSGLREIATRRKCHITSHISESADQVEYGRILDHAEHGSSPRTDAVVFASHGLLSDKCIMAHGVHLSNDDLDLMKEHGSAVAHCPLSNFFFAGGILPCRHLMERNNKVGLGTDVAGGYSPSVVAAARMAVVASQATAMVSQHQAASGGGGAVTSKKQLFTGTSSNSQVDPDEGHEESGPSHQSGQGSSPPSPMLDFRHAVYLATLGGAEALGLQDRIGTFCVGMEMDAIILSAKITKHRHPVPVFLDRDTAADVFQKLWNLGDDRNITHVFVQGRLVKELPTC